MYQSVYGHHGASEHQEHRQTVTDTLRMDGMGWDTYHEKTRDVQIDCESKKRFASIVVESHRFNGFGINTMDLG